MYARADAEACPTFLASAKPTVVLNMNIRLRNAIVKTANTKKRMKKPAKKNLNNN